MLAEIRKFGQIEVKKKKLDNNQFITSNNNDTNTAINREITTPPTNLPTSEHTTTVALVTYNEPASKDSASVETPSGTEASASESANNNESPNQASRAEASKPLTTGAEATKATGSTVERPAAGSRPGQYIINIPFQSVIAFSPFASDAYNNADMFEAEAAT